jgi:hypothetical protein
LDRSAAPCCAAAALKSKRSGIEVSSVLLSHARLEILRGNPAGGSRLLDDMAAKMAAHHQTNTDDRMVSIYRSEIAFATGKLAST